MSFSNISKILYYSGMTGFFIGLGCMVYECYRKRRSSCKPVILALRDPKTDEGEWKKAWVGYQDKNGNITGGLFHDNRDFISNQMKWIEILQVYHSLKKLGWKNMTVDDVRSTSGLKGYELGYSRDSDMKVSDINTEDYGITDDDEFVKSFTKDIENMDKSKNTEKCMNDGDFIEDNNVVSEKESK